MWARLSIAVLVLACAIPPALAQRYSFKYYGQEEGLNNLATECLFQDSAGYLWVGTQNGLFQYDGAAFTRFAETEGLPSSSIESLTETADGVLWVATQAGLARRRGGRFEEVQLEKGGEHASHFGLAVDQVGRLYLSTTSGLMSSAPPSAGSDRKFEFVPGQPKGPAYGLHVDRSGVAWYGCGSAVCRLAAGAVKVFGRKEGVPSARWDALLTDRDDNLWIRSSKNLLKKTPAGERFEPIAESVPNIGDFAALSLGRDGEIFVPTDEGVWELSKGHWRAIGQAQGLSLNSTSAVLQDREGSIWIGLWGAGVARWLGRDQWESWTAADGLSSEHIWMMTRDRRGDLWVTTNNGVNQQHHDQRTGRTTWRAWTEKDGIAGNKTRAIALAADGALWVGSSPGGISRIDPLAGTVRKYWLPDAMASDRIWNLSFDRAGTLWVATRGGLFFAKLGTGRVSFERQNLPKGDAGEMVFAAIEDARGRLWVAGTRGLARRENGVWRRFTVRDGLPTNSAGFLANGLDGSLWMGYRDRSGVSRIRTDQIRADTDRLSLETYNHNSGLRSEQAIFVRVDRRGWVWFGTDHGVDVLKDGKWSHYGRENGMVWDDCDSEAFYEDTDGSVWIGTSHGLAHLRVTAAERPAEGPRVEFTRFQLGNHVLDSPGRIVEPYQNRTLNARFSVLTFLAENEVRCRYRLTGLEQEWVETKQRDVRFSSLPYGKFVLEAIASNAAGEWSRTPARIAFEILPPWWATWWFRSAVFAVGLLAILQLIDWRTRRLKQEQVRLERAVEDRTRQLRLEQGRIERQNCEIEGLLEQARQTNLQKDEFLANMSHEIRTPMHGIIGMINFVLTGEMPAEQEKSLGIVRSCAQSLLSVLNDILDFSKVEAGKLEIVPAPFRVADTVRDACSIFAAGARDKGVGLVYEVAHDIPEWLECDAGRIGQVLLNLVGNALKFTHEGEIRVTAHAGAVSGDWMDLHFRVSDTGIGIPEASRKLVFEAFRQADGSTSRAYGGTGLGLTISSRLVQLMGGKIVVESEIGVGSVFSFQVKTRRMTAASEVGSSFKASEEAGPWRPLHILLAEDNPVNQKVATSLLNKRGHSVEVVGNGRLAVERSGAENFDLILMDFQMPEMDGLEATRRIRERDRGAGFRIPILALTAHAMSHAQQQCLAAGMDAVIVKPFNPEQFYKTVETAAVKGVASVVKT